MSKEKQIEEMVRDLENHTCMSQFQAEIASKMLYAKGYRKQSEGYWTLIGNGNGRPIHWKCSVCGYETLDAVNGDTNFCPNCGAKMKGGAE